MILTKVTLVVGLAGSLGIQPSPPEEMRTFHQKSSETCVDFTGIWRGTCESAGGGILESDFEIVQNACHSIEFDGDKLPIGGHKNEETVYGADNSSHVSSTVTFLSSENRRLHILNDTVFEWDSYRVELSARASYQRVGERLIVTTETNSGDYVCAYDYQGSP